MTKTYIRILRKPSTDLYISGKYLKVGLVIEAELFNERKFGEFIMCNFANGSTARKYRNTIGGPYYEHVNPLELLAEAFDD